jgi:Arc/MetJ family transcription regulator
VRRCDMATNLNIDDNLIEKAQKVGNFKTKKSAVTEALLEYIARRKQSEIIRVFDSINYDDS